MTITIYGVTQSRAMRNIWLAHELGIPFEQVEVNYADKSTRKPEFLAINPNGHIPAMRDGDLIMFESLAINLYLAKKHGGPLAPANLVEDGMMTMWSIWAITELEANCLKVLFHHLTPEEKRDAAAYDKAAAALQAPLKVLDAHLAASGGFIVGGRFTVADVNVAAIVAWLRQAPELLADKPALLAWRDAALKRPAFKAVYAKKSA